MNKRADVPTELKPGTGGSEAGGQHEGLRHPIDDDQRVEQRLDDVGLEDEGEVLEDHLRDRRSKGAPAAGDKSGDEAGREQRH